MAENYFKKLAAIDVNDKTDEKNGLTYLNWMNCWSEVKKIYPKATYDVWRNENSRFWFDDGRTGWVTVTVVIPEEEISATIDLPILDFKNKSIPADNITSYEANKAVMRCLVKACAMHGLGSYIYAKMDDTEDNLEKDKLKNECMELIKKRSALSDATKKKVGEICKEVLPDENGDPRLCTDNEKLETLKKKLMATRKIAE